MNLESVHSKTLNDMIETYQRGTPKHEAAITERRRRKRKAGRKHEPKRISKSRPNQKYLKKYSMNLQSIMKLLDFKYKNTCFDLDNAELLQHCISVAKIKKSKGGVL